MSPTTTARVADNAKARRVGTFIGATLTTLVVLTASACGPTEFVTVSNDCGHPVDAWVDRRGGQADEDTVDPEAHRDSVHVEEYADGQSRRISVGPGSPVSAMIISYGTDTAQVDFFGQSITGSNNYTITGDMCLPRETSE